MIGLAATRHGRRGCAASRGSPIGSRLNDVSAMPDNLADIATHWSVVAQAHQGSGTAVKRARQELMEHYSGAVYRYLLGALHDRHAADDLFQEFAPRFLRGDFKNADRERRPLPQLRQNRPLPPYRRLPEPPPRAPHPCPHGNRPTRRRRTCTTRSRSSSPAGGRRCSAGLGRRLRKRAGPAGRRSTTFCGRRSEEPDLSSSAMSASWANGWAAGNAGVGRRTCTGPANASPTSCSTRWLARWTTRRPNGSKKS